MSRPTSPTPSGSSSHKSTDNFIPVTHKKKIRPPKNRKGGGGGKQQHGVVRIQRTLEERLGACRVNLSSTGYLIACQKLLDDALNGLPDDDKDKDSEEDKDKKIESKVEINKSNQKNREICPIPVCIVCLGLGNITDSPKSRDQFIYLQDLMKSLEEFSIRKPLIYDPVFKEEDMEYFKTVGIEVLLKEHDLIFDVVTLIYMPHCPRSLFDDLLKKNWSVEGLKNLVIIGNRLDMYEDPAHPSSTSSAKAPFIVKAVNLFEILPLPIDTAHFDVFNDLALEWIPVEKLLALDETFWNFVPLEEGLRDEERKNLR